jgi:hypothetical protein
MDGRAPAGCMDGRAPAGCMDGRAPAGCMDGRAPAGCMDGRAPAGCMDGRAPAMGWLDGGMRTPLGRVRHDGGKACCPVDGWRSKPRARSDGGVIRCAILRRTMRRNGCTHVPCDTRMDACTSPATHVQPRRAPSDDTTPWAEVEAACCDTRMEACCDARMEACCRESGNALDAWVGAALVGRDSLRFEVPLASHAIGARRRLEGCSDGCRGATGGSHVAAWEATGRLQGGSRPAR